MESQLGCSARAGNLITLLTLILLVSSQVIDTFGQTSDKSESVANSNSNSEVNKFSAPKAAAAATTTSPHAQTSEQSASEQPIKSSSAVKEKKGSQPKRKSEACDYEKSNWEQCKANGYQQRTLRLKNSANAPNFCQPIKTIRRECRPASGGCKYARGDWSPNCLDGLRVRVDTLVGQVGNFSQSKAANLNCQPHRRVTKDCRRACHYIKSVWSECANGMKTRLLTLDESPLQVDNRIPKANSPNGHSQLEASVAVGCIKSKQIKRECSQVEQQTEQTGKGVLSSAAKANSVPKGEPQTITLAPKLGPTKLTMAQKRRFKQLQLQQRQTQPPTSTTSSGQIGQSR